MFGMSIRSVMERKKLLTASPAETVARAAKRMAKRNVGAVMVVEEGRLAGIFTERDVVYRVVAAGRDPATTRLAEVMTPQPKTVGPDDTFGYALVLMHENGFRHTPVVEDGRPVGIVSARNALDPDLEEFEHEARRREHLRRSGAARAVR
ncbi:MAG: cyclic nucleotide-binding/CBS domain-containing protein [Clostridia bacterium]